MMAYMRIRTLVVLTLLQLCRAEISNTPESWYSANVISDSFQPKPISEIFSTEPTFSSANPIIVQPTSTEYPDEVESVSTLSPPTPQVSITSTSGAIPQMSTTPSPLPTQTSTLSTLGSHSETSSNVPLQTSAVTVPPPIQPINQTPSILPPHSTEFPPGPYQEVLPLLPTAPHYEHSAPQFQPEQFEFVSTPEPPTYEISQSSLESLFRSLPRPALTPEITLVHLNNHPESIIVQDQVTTPQPTLSTEISTPQPTLSTELTTIQPTFPPQSSLTTQTTLFPSSTILSEPSSPPVPTTTDQPIPSDMPPQQIQAEVINRQTLPTHLTVQGPSVPSSPGQWQQIRFEVVPQSPQPASGQPTQTGSTGPSMSFPGSTQQPLSNYFMIYQQAPQSFQSYPSRPLVSPNALPQSPSTLPPRASDFSPTTLPPLSTVVTQVPPQTTRPPVSTHQPVTSVSPPTVSSANPCSLSNLRSTNIPGTLQGFPIFPMRIRVVSPSGSITNIQINPKVMPTTTTRRPTTTRTRKIKPKKNTYDYCVNSCKGPRNPICAAPLSTSAIDPETLKGFPSICHMACHNSYRVDSFEKIADGRCGRLRTKIRPLDSNAKLKKNELVKTEYSIDQTGQKAVIEFSSRVA